MIVTVALLRAAGLTEAQINRVTELADAEHTENRRAQWRKQKRNQRSRPQCPVEPADTTILTSLPSSSLPSIDRPLATAARARTKFQYPPEFLAWWEHYPRHEAKDAAFKAWIKVIDAGKATNEELIAGAMRYATDPNRDPSFTKHGATWLNAGCHTDGPLPPRGGQNGQGRPAPKDDPRSIRGAFDRLAEHWGPGWEDEARELSRQAHLRIVSGGSGERS